MDTQFLGWCVDPDFCHKKLIFVINRFVFRPKVYCTNSYLSKTREQEYIVLLDALADTLISTP